MLRFQYPFPNGRQTDVIINDVGVFCLAVYSNAARALRSARCGLLDSRAGRMGLRCLQVSAILGGRFVERGG